MNRERFSAIGHTGIEFWNPVSPRVLQRLIEGLPLGAESRVLDVGCGRAELLLRIVERYGCHAVGVDTAETAIAAAQRSAAARLERGQVDLCCERFDAGAFAGQMFDLAVCVGSTHAVSDFEGAVRVLPGLVRPGGLVLVGDGYWRRAPDGEYLTFLGCGADDLRSHAQNAALAMALGLEVVECHETTDAEWSRYEDTYAQNIVRFVESNPDDPDAAAMGERIRGWRKAYLHWGRETLGFGLYLLRKPSSGG